MPGSAVMLDPLLDEPGWIRIRIQDGRFRAGFADLEYASGKLRGLKWGAQRTVPILFRHRWEDKILLDGDDRRGLGDLS